MLFGKLVQVGLDQKSTHASWLFCEKRRELRIASNCPADMEENHAVKELWQRRKKLTGEYGLPGPHLLMPYEQAKGFFDTSKVPIQSQTSSFEI